MIKRPNTNAQRLKRHKRVRAKISGTPEMPRLNVFRSEANIYAQTALEYETIYISGGRIGAQVEAAPGDLIRLLRAQTADIIVNKA